MGRSGAENSPKPFSSDPTDLEKAYLKAFPGFIFPESMDKETRAEAIQASKGRKIIILSDGKYFFEQIDEQISPEIKDLKRFLGCGG